MTIWKSLKPASTTSFVIKEWVRMDILPNGDVTPCIQYPELTFGNLRNLPVMDAWNSPEFERFRASLRRRLLHVCSKCYALYLYDAKRSHL
jgi:radical SAM protein with 4Fe4S-binding SPASM domain